MTRLEGWLLERMTVRRWCLTLSLVVIVSAIGYSIAYHAGKEAGADARLNAANQDAGAVDVSPVASTPTERTPQPPAIVGLKFEDLQHNDPAKSQVALSQATTQYIAPPNPPVVPPQKIASPAPTKIFVMAPQNPPVASDGELTDSLSDFANRLPEIANREYEDWWADTFIRRIGLSKHQCNAVVSLDGEEIRKTARPTPATEGVVLLNVAVTWDEPDGTLHHDIDQYQLVLSRGSDKSWTLVRATDKPLSSKNSHDPFAGVPANSDPPNESHDEWIERSVADANHAGT